jgi:multidrug efflux pump subunit AcrB
MKELLANTTDVVDIDWMVEDAQPEMQFVVDNEKAMRYGVTPAQINGTLQMLLAKQQIGALYAPADMVQVPIRFGLTESDRSGVAELGQITVVNQQGKSIPLSTFIEVVEGSRKPTIYRKNQRRVTYVTADMAGEGESPVYAILGQTEAIEAFDIPEGYEVKEAYMGAPFTTEDVTVKWDGEWQITLEVFRDLGTAFGVVLIVIYILIVGWFQNFKVPLVMMVAIPLSLVGIILGHWFMGAFFTATSMIGTIALAGIMVRNSVLLIDFINLRLEDGVPLKQAAIEAGAVRTTPILLTAGTVVIGAFVILFDPIFQGLAIALMGGSIASTVLTLLVVPVVYYMTERKNHPEEPMVEDVIEMNPKA